MITKGATEPVWQSARVSSGRHQIKSPVGRLR